MHLTVNDDAGSTWTRSVDVTADKTGGITDTFNLPGNQADAKTVNVKIDKTDPTISAAATKSDDSEYVSGTWTNQTVTVQFSCDDALSGIVAGGCPADVVHAADTAAGADVSGSVSDRAGNSTTSNVINVKVDKTNPVVTVTGVAQGGVYTLGSVPAAGCSTIDALSGKKTDAALQVTVSTVGSFTASCNGGEDTAGNTASATMTYTVVYRWDGFLQPINDTAHQTGVAQSKFKLGSTVPVKFRIKDFAGAPQQQDTAPTFTRGGNRGSCDSQTVVEDPVAEVPISGLTFRWDTTLQGYIFNWSTKGLQRGEYRIYAHLADTTAPYVDVCLW